MFRSRSPVYLLVLMLAAGALWSQLAVADAAPAIPTIISASVSRTLHGDARSLQLSAAGREVGSARAFFGIDDQSTASRQYLTSGLAWQAGAPGAATLNLTALHSESRGDQLGGQTVLSAENRIDLGGRWFMPDVSAEVAQVSNRTADGNALGGRAARLGLVDTLGPAQLSVDYFQADPQFDALGTSLVAGNRGWALGSRVAIGTGWQLTQDLRLSRAMQSPDQTSAVQEWVVSRTSRPTDIGEPWRLSARMGNSDANASAAGGSSPIALELAAQSAYWRSWRLDSSLGWYAPDAHEPQGLPVAGTLWQVSASRGLVLGGWRTHVSPRLSVGGSRNDGRPLAARTGLNLSLDSLSDRMNLSLAYVSAGWSAAHDHRGDVQMMLNYSQDTGGLIPGLATAIRHLHLPWQRRR